LQRTPNQTSTTGSLGQQKDKLLKRTESKQAIQPQPMSQDGEPELAKIQSTMADAIPFTQLISKCAE